MGKAKDLRLSPIQAGIARRFVEQHHYSGRTVQNAKLNLGAFMADKLVGVMQFGSPMYKRGVLSFVEGTAWNGMVELNRMAFLDDTPRNAESRALGVAFRLMQKQWPQVEWVLSFADGTLCGDGTIYRAAGFVLVQIKRNTNIYQSPPDSLGRREYRSQSTLTHGMWAAKQGGRSSMKAYKDAGWELIPGFQLCYIRFLNPAARARLTLPEIPFSEIAARGAAMYKGERTKVSSEPPGDQPGKGGAIPTRALQNTQGQEATGGQAERIEAA